MSKTALDITQGVNELSNRAAVKATFEQFGEVATCWLPPPTVRKDETGIKAYVKFVKGEAAQAAHDACKDGRVFIEEYQVGVAWRSSDAPRHDSREFEAHGSNLMSARDMILREQRKNKGKGGSRDNDRSRGNDSKKKKKDSSSSSSSSSSAKKKKKKKGKKKSGDSSLDEELEKAAEKPEEAPLLVAAARGTVVRCMQLINAGAYVNQLGLEGLNSLHLGAKRGSPEVCEALLQAKADINMEGAEGAGKVTALHLAVAVGSVKLCTDLLNSKAAVNAQRADGFTPLHIATATNLLKLSDLLRKAGANEELKDSVGKTVNDLIKDKQTESEKKKEAEAAEQEKRRLQRERRMKNMKSLEEREAEARAEKQREEDKKKQRKEKRSPLEVGDAEDETPAAAEAPAGGGTSGGEPPNEPPRKEPKILKEPVDCVDLSD